MPLDFLNPFRREKKHHVRSASDVTAAFQYYLGRYPEDDDAHDWHHRKSGGQLDRLRDILGDTDEFRRNVETTVRSSPGTYFAPRPNAPKICVLGNCQGPNIAIAIAALAAQPVSVCGLEIMDVGNRRAEFERLISDADYVVACQVFNDIYKPVSASHIRTHIGKRVLEYSPVHFTGLHPDMLVLGSYGQRILSPLGDYNSRITLSAYLNGLNESQAADQFTQAVYERAHYFHEFEWSTNTILQREGALDEDGIRIADWLLPTIREKPLLYTMNHPNSRVFERFAVQILDRIGIEHRPLPIELIPNTLSTAAIWPVDPIIAEANGTCYNTSHTYWANNVALPLDEFIWRSFRAYDQIESETLSDAMGKRVIEMS
jgi:hypothetical protein